MNFIKHSAQKLGFDACGIAQAGVLTDDKNFMQAWLNNGNHADMNYLANNFDKRTDPRILVPGCKSIIVVLLNYFPKELQKVQSPKIAKYAYSATDYHFVLKAKLSELEQVLISEYGNDFVSSEHQHLFVDSAPVLERRWAERAGLGWIGKHTQLINPGIGSYFFIGILMVNKELDYDSPIKPRCGTCTRCIDSCPTQALTLGIMNARRCISYQTIENRNEIDPEIVPLLSNCAIGCDICADVCPWNKKWSHAHNHPELKALPELYQWDKSDWENITKPQFNEIFKSSAIKRAGFKKLKQTISQLEIF